MYKSAIPVLKDKDGEFSEQPAVKKVKVGLQRWLLAAGSSGCRMKSLFLKEWLLVTGPTPILICRRIQWLYWSP